VLIQISTGTHIRKANKESDVAPRGGVQQEASRTPHVRQ
jgi:hypothetical protein